MRINVLKVYMYDIILSNLLYPIFSIMNWLCTNGKAKSISLHPVVQVRSSLSSYSRNFEPIVFTEVDLEKRLY